MPGWRLSLLAALVACPLFSARADDAESVKAGIYLLSIDEIDTANGLFKATFWAWYCYPPEGGIKPEMSREFLNARDFKIVTQDAEKKGDVVWATEKVQGTFSQSLDVAAFPYDKHQLTIVIEESLHETDKVRFKADVASSGADGSASLPDGWKLRGFSLETGAHHYATNFGNPESGEGSEYHQIIATISIEREGKGLLGKMLFGLYVAILIGIISFFMKTSSEDIFASRIGLLVGMVFATILSKESAENIVGVSARATLSDRLHNWGFAYLFAMIAVTLLSRRLVEEGREGRAKLLDRTAAATFALTFTVLNYLLIFRL